MFIYKWLITVDFQLACSCGLPVDNQRYCCMICCNSCYCLVHLLMHSTNWKTAVCISFVKSTLKIYSMNVALCNMYFIIFCYSAKCCVHTYRFCVYLMYWSEDFDRPCRWEIITVVISNTYPCRVTYFVLFVASQYQGMHQWL